MPTGASETPDVSLVVSAQGGQEAAFEELFGRHYGGVRRFAFRVALGSQAADDIAQETFIRAARQIGGMREPQAFVAWLYRIAANVAKDHLRAAGAHRRKLAVVSQELESAAGDSLTAAESRVHDALQALPVDQRAAAVLVYLEDCNHAEAARRLGCAESTVSWRIFRAKRQLRKLLTS